MPTAVAGTDRRPLMVVAGPVDPGLAALDSVDFDAMPLNGAFGTASPVKLVPCGVSKGINLTLAPIQRRHRTQHDLAVRVELSIPFIPADVVPSKSEFAELDRQLGALGLLLVVARRTADPLDLIAGSPLGSETRDSRDASRDMAASVRLPETAAGSAGVGCIDPDLETLGKSDWQKDIDTRVSVHDQTIMAALKGAGGALCTFCRIDPVNPVTGDQIDALIRMGAEPLMLPFFQNGQEAETFVCLVDGRANTTIPCETAAAVFRMHAVVRAAGVDEIRICLTDLMLSTKVGSRDERLASDTLERSSEDFHAADKPLHLAGVARVDDDTLPVSSDLTLARYAELGISGSLVTRAFARKCPIAAEFAATVTLMRERVDYWTGASPAERRAKAGELRTLARSARGRKGAAQATAEARPAPRPIALLCCSRCPGVGAAPFRQRLTRRMHAVDPPAFRLPQRRQRRHWRTMKRRPALFPRRTVNRPWSRQMRCTRRVLKGRVQVHPRTRVTRIPVAPARRQSRNARLRQLRLTQLQEAGD